MTSLIPFVGQISYAEQCDWARQISDKLPDVEVVPFSDLSLKDFDAVQIAITANPDPVELDKLKNLRWIHSVWAGVERMVIELKDKEFDIVRLVDPELSRTMAEAVLAWTLYLHRHMPQYREQQQKKIWNELSYKKASNTAVGILGLGALGQEAALRLKANGYQVKGWSRSLKSVDGLETYSGDEGLTEILKTTDILVVLLPLTDQTRGLLNERMLGLLPAGASIINFARGPIIQSEDLLALLDGGHLSHAVLDVFDEEPLPQTSPFWEHAQITVLPHISAPTDMDTASEIVANNIRLYLEKGVTPTFIDRQRGY
ncbi:2-hydroxyacid dehydrogenase [Sneathiella limimaris]|uniref:2-hydroxyacid dehydrogenase n=1 Tax=Sneathiella limimaris TaxID=1964213 RepID=UPI00146AF1A1|nr:glyoxylate/hydroxypyruvate reductase A [Sneathiella limimaris]